MRRSVASNRSGSPPVGHSSHCSRVRTDALVVIPGKPRSGPGRSDRDPRLVVAAALVAGSLIACSGGAGSPSQGATEGSIITEGFAFVPSTIGVPVGGSLVFFNRDEVGHTVTEGASGRPAANARFDEVLEATPDARVVVAFPAAGVVSIICRVHPAMALTVTIGDDAIASPAQAASPASAPSPYSRTDY